MDKYLKPIPHGKVMIDKLSFVSRIYSSIWAVKVSYKSEGGTCEVLRNTSYHISDIRTVNYSVFYIMMIDRRNEVMFWFGILLGILD